VEARRKLIVVSNRGPASFQLDEDGKRVARRGGGGLVTALRSLVAQHDVTWIASAMTSEDRVVAEESGGVAIDEIAHDGSPFRLRLVAHDAPTYDRFYNVVANPTLWFLQHYLWELAHTPTIDNSIHHAWADGYVRVNEAFAEAVAEELDREPEATVFLHDYHLYVAPRLIRDRVPDAMLAHFVHIPWPQTDYWHILPAAIRHEIHDGLLANDIVGFHAHRWRLAFLRSAVDVLGAECDFEDFVARYRDGRTLVTCRPLSIDTGEFEALAASPHVLAAEEQIAAARPEKLVLRVDRTDPSKNVVRGFRSFEHYLDEHPEMHGRVGMLALLDPSRQDIPEYSEYLGAIQREARRVNDRFEREGWIPIELDISDDFPRSVAAYKQYDVLLVNAIYDGLNLVAKEGPYVNERDGVLLLSENTGAHAELGEWALTVNPFDVSAQANAIHEALEMDAAERRRRQEAIKAQIREHDVMKWSDGLLADVDRWTERAVR
jgi:trehalose 6-phosphate synthase